MNVRAIFSRLPDRDRQLQAYRWFLQIFYRL